MTTLEQIEDVNADRDPERYGPLEPPEPIPSVWERIAASVANYLPGPAPWDDLLDPFQAPRLVEIDIDDIDIDECECLGELTPDKWAEIIQQEYEELDIPNPDTSRIQVTPKVLLVDVEYVDAARKIHTILVRVWE